MGYPVRRAGSDERAIIVKYGLLNISAFMANGDNPVSGNPEDCSNSIFGRVTRRTTLGAIWGFAADPVSAQAIKLAGVPKRQGPTRDIGEIAERVGLYIDIPKLRFAPSVTQIGTIGHSIAGLGMATYAEVLGESGTAHEANAWRTRDADGRLWEIAHQGVVFDTQFGARVDGETDDGAALQAAVDYVAARSLTLRLVYGTRISGRDLIVSDPETRRERRSFFAILGPAGGPGFTANRQATIRFVNHAERYHADPTTGPVGIRFEHTGLEKGKVEQSGASNVVLAGFAIIPANRGVGVLVSESNNFSISLSWSYQDKLALPQSYLVLRGTTSIYIRNNLFSSCYWSPILITASARVGRYGKTYNDTVVIEDNKFAGRSFALVIDAGSTSFGVRSFQRNTKGSGRCHYAYIAGRGLALRYVGNWLEGCAKALISWAGTPSPDFVIPGLGGADADGIADSLRYQDVLTGGWSFSIFIQGNIVGNQRANFDLSGFLQCSGDIAGNVNSGGSTAAIEYDVRGPAVGFGGLRVAGSYYTKAPNPHFRTVQSELGNIGRIGYQGAVSPGWRESRPIGSHATKLGAGRPVADSIIRHFDSRPAPDYPVLKIPLAFTGIVRLAMTIAGTEAIYTVRRKAIVPIVGIGGRGRRGTPQLLENVSQDGERFRVSPEIGLYFGMVEDIVHGEARPVRWTGVTLECPGHGLADGDEVTIFGVRGADKGGVTVRAGQVTPGGFLPRDAATGVPLASDGLKLDGGATARPILAWPALYCGFAGFHEGGESVGLIAEVEVVGAAISALCQHGNIVPEWVGTDAKTAAREIAIAGRAGRALQQVRG
jgi:hypothetical protein